MAQLHERYDDDDDDDDEVYESEILRSALKLYLCVLYGSQKKQRLFPDTASTDLVFITERECVYCAVRTGSVNKTDYF